MQSLLTFMTLYGLSFSVWGSVGICRFVSERSDQVRRQPYLVGLIMAAGASLALSLVWGYPPTTPASEPAPFAGGYTFGQVLTLVSLGSLAGSFTAARLFRLPFSGAAVLAFAAYCGVALWFAAEVMNWGTDAIGARSQMAFAVLGFAIMSGAIGLALTNGTPRFPTRGTSTEPPPGRIRLDEVAVMIPAHNEESSIGACLAAITKVVPPDSVYVASDGSTDNTVGVVREWGCNVADIQPGRGKAKALHELLGRFGICGRYRAVMILDADSEIDPHYMQNALPLFDDPSVAAVAGHAFPNWESHRWPMWRMFYIGYRVRLYKVTQAFLRYGQTWRHSNVSFIIPGFASMYRCSILPKIDMTAPGLIIEDFNMTFEVHHKNLGKIAYTPRVRCMCQDPTNLRDYIKQVKRWNLGLWQTIRLHGVWPSFFWLSLAVFIVEISLQSAMFLTVPFVLTWFAFAPEESLAWWSPAGMIELSLSDVVIGVLLADYLLTVIVAVLERKPMLLFYGLGFLIPRWIDSLLFLVTLPMTWFVRSDGRWVSPQRS